MKDDFGSTDICSNIASTFYTKWNLNPVIPASYYGIHNNLWKFTGLDSKIIRKSLCAYQHMWFLQCFFILKFYTLFFNFIDFIFVFIKCYRFFFDSYEIKYVFVQVEMKELFLKWSAEMLQARFFVQIILSILKSLVWISSLSCLLVPILMTLSISIKFIFRPQNLNLKSFLSK